MSKNLATVVWKPLCQIDNGVFTVVRPRKNAEDKRVIDKVDVDDRHYVRAFDLRLTTNTRNQPQRLTAKSRKHLNRLRLEHHVLGPTYP